MIPCCSEVVLNSATNVSKLYETVLLHTNKTFSEPMKAIEGMCFTFELFVFSW